MYTGPGATPPSLARPISVFSRGTEFENVDRAESSAGLSPGGRVARGIFSIPSRKADPPLSPPTDGSKVDRRPGGIPTKTPLPPTPRDAEALFTSTGNSEFDHSSFYMEDDIFGDAGLVPAKLALNNPIGRQPRDRRMELPWARDGWQMDDKGNLVSERGERLKLDQYQRNFWRKREKNLRRDEDRRRKQLDKAKELAAVAQERLEKRKRERSEEASRIKTLFLSITIDLMNM